MSKKEYELEKQMRKAIKNSNLSCYQISKLTGVSEAQLSLFMNHKRSLTLVSASKITKVLGLKLKPKRK